MKKFLTAGFLVLLLGCKESNTSNQVKTSNTTPYTTENKLVFVYTTADSANLRFSPMDTLVFADKGQPFEDEIVVFVDPDQTFQTYMGIGAALTDASAEVFAKLSKEKQQEFLTAHFDKEKGLGYTIARTNIHSCDFSSDM